MKTDLKILKIAVRSIETYMLRSDCFLVSVHYLFNKNGFTVLRKLPLPNYYKVYAISLDFLFHHDSSEKNA